MDSEEQKHRKELFEGTCKRLRAFNDTTRGQVQERIDEIALNLMRNEAEAKAAKGAPTLGKVRSQLDALITILERHNKHLDIPEDLFRYGRTATDNPHADPANRQRGTERQEAVFQKQQVAKAANEAFLAELRRGRKNPSWETARGPLPFMESGTTASNFVADCVKMFEYFRPGEMSWKPGSDLYVVAANIYELITRRSLEEKGADFSLEHRLTEAVKQYRRTVLQP